MFNYKNKRLTSSGEINHYESSLKLDYDVYSPKWGRYYKIYDSCELIAEVTGNNIKISGKSLAAQNYPTEWILSSEPLNILRFNSNGEYVIEDEVVATISGSGGIINWLIDMFQKKNYFPYEPYCKIVFDESKLEPFVALCLLFKSVEHSTSS